MNLRSLSLLALSLATPLACRRRAPRETRAWHWENPSPQGNRLEATCIDAGGRAYAVGVRGSLVVREDQGAWRAARPVGRQDLHGIACASTGVWAVGDEGLVLRSRDRGVSWERVTIGTRTTLYAVATAGRDVLIAGSGVVLRAPDGERFARAEGVDGAELRGVWTDGTVAVAVGVGGTVLRASDGGARWSRVESGTQRTLTAAWGSSAEDLYAVGAGGTVLVSANRGAQWTVLPRTLDDDLRAVVGVGRRDVFVVGSSGLVMRARDGVQFVREDSSAPGDLRGIALRGEEAVAVGDRGAIVERGTGGRWRLRPSGHRGTLHAVWRGPDGSACAVGQGGAILCRDPSLGWVPVSSGVRANLGGIASDGAGTFVAVGDYGTLLRSTDRGRTWALLPTGDRGTLEPGDTTTPTWAQLPTRQNKVLAAVWMGPRGDALAVGRDGIVLRSTDHGARWSRVDSGITQGLFGVWSDGSGRAWACGVGGALIASDDGGARWHRITTNTPQDLFAVGGEGRDVWVVGRLGTMLRATDGEHFARIDAGTTDTLLSVSGARGHLWIASVSGHLLHTRSRGARWDQSPVGTGDDFTAVHAASDGRVSLVGYWGTILGYY